MPVHRLLGGPHRDALPLSLSLATGDPEPEIDEAEAHRAAGIGPLVREILEGGADIAMGSRFLPPGGGYTSTPARRAGIACFMPRKTPVALMSMTRFHWSSVCSAS